MHLRSFFEVSANRVGAFFLDGVVAGVVLEPMVKMRLPMRPSGLADMLCKQTRLNLPAIDGYDNNVLIA